MRQNELYDRGEITFIQLPTSFSQTKNYYNQEKKNSFWRFGRWEKRSFFWTNISKLSNLKWFIYKSDHLYSLYRLFTVQSNQKMIRNDILSENVFIPIRLLPFAAPTRLISRSRRHINLWHFIMLYKSLTGTYYYVFCKRQVYNVYGFVCNGLASS